MEITLRQKKILATIVKEYSETANPVGSAELVDRYNLKVSSATIRNEMSALEKMGYIYQPHKSAGRVPTDAGYRFFINELMQRFELSERERKHLRSELQKLQQSHDQLGRSISNLVARISGQAAFALLPSDSASAGLSHIARDPEFRNAEAVSEVAELFDHIDQHAGKLLKSSQKGIDTFIGRESPLPVPKNMSLVVSKIKLPNGKKGVIGIVGPKRMSYAKNQSLLSYLAKLISGTSVILVIMYA